MSSPAAILNLYFCANLEEAIINSRQFTNPSQKFVIINVQVDNVEAIGIL